jgi:hypothetical protein
VTGVRKTRSGAAACQRQTPREELHAVPSASKRERAGTGIVHSISEQACVDENPGGTDGIAC